MMSSSKRGRGIIMDKIEIKTNILPDKPDWRVFVINGRPLYEYFIEWFKGEQIIHKPAYLSICWTDDYDLRSNALFMRYCLEQEHANVPILSCPDDFDFSCLVVAAEVEKTEDKVFWHRIGFIDNTNWSLEDERKSGVLLIEKYTDEDWEKFGNTFVFENTDSEAFKNYEHEHWEDENLRRRINHTFPYYQKEENVRWFSSSGFEFTREEYENLVNSCYNSI